MAKEIEKLANTVDEFVEGLVPVVKAYVDACNAADKKARSDNKIGNGGQWVSEWHNPVGKVRSALESAIMVATTAPRYRQDGQELPGPVLRRVSR